MADFTEKIEMTVKRNSLELRRLYEMMGSGGASTMKCPK
jgi:hypothetical protein